MTEVASVPGAEDFGDQAAESIARAQQIAALGLPALPDDPAAAAAMRAAGYVVIAECAEVAGTTAIVSVLSEDEGLEQRGRGRRTRRSARRRPGPAGRDGVPRNLPGDPGDRAGPIRVPAATRDGVGSAAPSLAH